MRLLDIDGRVVRAVAFGAICGLGMALAPPVAHAAECALAGGERIDALRAREIVVQTGGLVLPVGAILDAPLDRALLCGESAGAPPAGAKDCEVRGPLGLECVRLAKGVDVEGVTFLSDVSLEEARIEGGVRFARVDVRGALVLGGARVRGATLLDGVSVGALAAFDEARLEGACEIRDVEIAGTFSLQGVEAEQAVVIERVRGGGLDLALDRGGSLTVREVASAGDVHLDDVALAGDLALTTIRAEGAIDIAKLRVAGEATLSGLEAAEGIAVTGSFERDLVIAGSRSPETIAVTDADVRGNLALRAIDTPGGLVVSGAKVGGAMTVEYSVIASPTRFADLAIGGECALVGSHFAGGITVANVAARGGTRTTECDPLDPFAP